MKVFDYICKSPKFKYFFKHPTDNILFFDIETTGLSPNASSLYMIGVMFFDNSDGNWHLKQFFADNYKSEADMINSFLDILEDYDYLYHFNGKTFDIPYVLNKCSKHSISLSEHCDNILNDKENSFSIDILAGIRPVKKMLGLTKANQTALERWLGIIRDDKFDGGKLIPVYTDFMQKKILAPEKAEELEKILLLHNYEDIENMLNVASIMSYNDISTLSPFSDDETIFSGYSKHFDITEITIDDDGMLNISCSFPELIFPKSLETSITFPESNSEEYKYTDDMLIVFENDTILLKVPILSGVLYNYIKNYKDYYYFSDKDTALHKSVAAYMDKKYRKKATAITCYTKKQGYFIPTLKTCKKNKADTDNIFTEYKLSLRDKISFYNIDTIPTLETANKSNGFWKNYVCMQLRF